MTPDDEAIHALYVKPIEDAAGAGLFDVPPPPGSPPVDILDTITALYRKIRDQQRIIACCDGDSAQGVQRLIDHHQAGDMYEVVVSPFCPAGQVVIFDRHTVADLAGEFPYRWSWSARNPEG